MGGGREGSKLVSEGADELNGALNRGFFPVVFTDCGHFFVLALRSASPGFLTRFSPRGFDQVFAHQEGQGGVDHGAAVRRRPSPATRCNFSSDVLKLFLFGYLLVLERYAGNGATL